MSRNRRRSRRGGDKSSEPTPKQPETVAGGRKAPSVQPSSEPRVQSGVVESAKKSLMRASSASPTGGIRPVEIEPGKVASARRTLTSTFAANTSNGQWGAYFLIFIT